MMVPIKQIGFFGLLPLAFSAYLGLAQAPVPPEPGAPSGHDLTIAAGQKFILRLETPIHTNSTRKGEHIEFKTAGDILVDGQVAIPMDSGIRATVTQSKRAGRLAGRAEVRLRLDEVQLAGGNSLPLKATIIRVGMDLISGKNGQPTLRGESGSGGNARAVASAGAQGAIIGVMTAGAKGAMYGSAIGAGISLAGMLFKRGPDLDLPQDTMFEAKFDQSLAVPLAVAQQGAQRRPGEPADSAVGAPGVEDPSAQAGPVPQKPVLRGDEGREKAPVEEVAGPPSSRDPVPEKPAEVNADPAPAPETIPPSSPPLPSSSTVPPAESAPADRGAFKLSVAVRMVVVDAVVRDRAGRMIENLKREDFRVFEDGDEQPIESFSRDEEPLAIALVVDRSGSVAPYISELRRIAARTLDQLKPVDQVALFSFAGSVARVVDLTADRRKIAEGLGRIHGGGGTDIIDALFDATAYLRRAAPDYRRAVILISDNQATVHPRASEGETIRMAMETETVIYSVKTAGEGIPLSMRLPDLIMGAGSVNKVTRETGGEIIDARNVGMLDRALSAVISRLRLRYALGYYPPHPDQGGAFHTIEVRLTDRFGRPGSEYTVHARRGYYATADNASSPGRARRE